MDKTELARLKELAEKATPGPWADGQNVEKVLGRRHDKNQGTVYMNYKDCGPYPRVEVFYNPDEGNMQTEQDAAYIAAANPQAILDLIGQSEYLQVLEEERSEYYQQFDKLADLLGVFHETDPGKPETFSVFIREFVRMKQHNERIEKEATWLANKLVAASEMLANVTGMETDDLNEDCWRKMACEAVEKENESHKSPD